MSEFHVEVVRIGSIEKHPNADTLGITRVRDYPVISKLGEFQEGELAIYIPVDSVVPAEDTRWAFLQGHTRIKAKRLRGTFSMGLLTKAAPEMKEGENVAEILGIKKYEPPENFKAGGEVERCPFEFPKYTDIEGLRRWPDILQEGEEVHLTEKIHGTNFRAAFKDGRLWIGSHREIKKQTPEQGLWQVALNAGLQEKLAKAPNVAFYGEVYGWVQDLRYGHDNGKRSILFFDALDLTDLKYLDVEAFEELASRLELPLVPKDFRGPWEKGLAESYSELKSQLAPNQIREGVVIRPVRERFDDRIGRVILKRHGEAYLLRK